MSEVRDLRSVIEAAEQSASAGDYHAAERFLWDAASLQEASLGPLHPDLANTLNNLGVVYETIDQPADAERCYRRAYAIAIAALEPDHPFVATSAKNLRDFCHARGIPVEMPSPPPAPMAPDAATPAALDAAMEEVAPLEIPAAAQPRERPADEPVSQPMAPAKPSRPRAGGILGVLGLVALAGAGVWFAAGDSEESREPVASPPPLESAAPVPEPPPVEPSPVEPAPAAPKAANDRGRPVEPAPARRAASRGTAVPAVDDASVCRSLSRPEWRCSPAGPTVASGLLFFYTRIKSPIAMTVEHRWYHNDRLHRNVALRIQPNLRSGFRTYSRTAVTPGDWRLEVRTRDGAVLHEERFVVR